MNQPQLASCSLHEAETLQKDKRIKAPPPLYSVYLQDGNQSTIDFIIDIIRIFFFFSYEKAKEIILNKQDEGGKIICGIYTKDVAETKVQQVNRYLKKYKCELTCGMEPM